MAILYLCEKCGRAGQARDELAGRSAKCPDCGASIELGPAPEPADPAAGDRLTPTDELIAALQAFADRRDVRLERIIYRLAGLQASVFITWTVLVLAVVFYFAFLR